MTRSMLCAMVCAIALIGGQAMADDVAAATCGDDLCYSGCEDAGGGSGSLYALVDLTFMKYHQAGGVRDSNAQMGEFGFEFNPRYVIGYERSDGLGTRIGYWGYDEAAATVGVDWINIDAYAFDVEIYQRVDLGSCTSVEVFGGLRWIDIEVTDNDALFWAADGYGGKVGIEAARKLGSNNKLFARATWSIVPVDGQVVNPGNYVTTLVPANGILEDSEVTITEVGAGIAGSRCLNNCSTLVYGAGAEWAQWSDVSVGGDTSNEIQTADGGWAGFFFRLGLQY